jgi:hypothetical protein
VASPAALRKCPPAGFSNPGQTLPRLFCLFLCIIGQTLGFTGAALGGVDGRLSALHSSPCHANEFLPERLKFLNTSFSRFQSLSRLLDEIERSRLIMIRRRLCLKLERGRPSSRAYARNAMHERRSPIIPEPSGGRTGTTSFRPRPFELDSRVGVLYNREVSALGDGDASRRVAARTV